jgi:hypothetical protein
MRLATSCLLSISIAAVSIGQPTKSRSPASPLSAGIALYDADRLERAKSLLTPLATAGDPDAMFYLGRIAVEQNRGDEAVDWLEQKASLE